MERSFDDSVKFCMVCGNKLTHIETEEDFEDKCSAYVEHMEEFDFDTLEKTHIWICVDKDSGFEQHMMLMINKNETLEKDVFTRINATIYM